MTEHKKRSWNDITSTVGLPAEETETVVDGKVLSYVDPEATRTVLSTAQNPLVKTGVILAGVTIILGGVGTYFYLNQPSNPEVASKPTTAVLPPNTQIADLETENSKLKADNAFGLTPTGKNGPDATNSPSTGISSPTPNSSAQIVTPPVVAKNPTPVQSVAVTPIVTPSKVTAPVMTPVRMANSIASSKPVVVAKQITQAPRVSQRDRDIAAAINSDRGKRRPELAIASTVVQSRMPPINTIPLKLANPPALIVPIAKPGNILQRDRDIASAITGKPKQIMPSIRSTPKKPIIASVPIALAPSQVEIPVDWKAASTSGTFGGRYDRNPGNNLASNQIPKAIEPVQKAVGELAEVPVIPAVLPSPVVQQVALNIPLVTTPIIQPIATIIPAALPNLFPTTINRFVDIGNSNNRLQTIASFVGNNKGMNEKEKIEPLKNTVIYSSDEMPVIIASAVYESLPSEQSILPGQVLKASLATPLQLLSEDSTGKPILLNVNSPIVDLNGHIAIPAGAQVAGTFVTSNNGFVQLRTERLVYQGKEIILPDNLFAIQSENGEPLLARSIQPGIGEATALARETGFYGAAQRVGQVLTAPDTNNTFNSSAGGTFSSSSSQNNRNVLGAVVEGFSNPIVQQQQQRSTAEIARISGQQRIVYLPIGHKFNLVIARTFKMR